MNTSEVPKKETRRGFTLRAVVLGCLLSFVFTLVSSYLQINFGMGFGFGVVTIFLAYVFFHKMLGGSSKREIALAFIMSGSGLSVAWALGFFIFLQESVPGANLPAWLVPSPEALQNKVLTPNVWITPIVVIFFLTVTSGLLGLIMAYCTYRLFVQSKRMVFPSLTANAVIIDSCFKREGHIRLLAYFLVAGFAFTFVQFILKTVGIETTLLDLSPYLPKGFLFGVAINIAFVAVGYFISAPVALSILISSLASYLVAAPILVNQGVVAYTPDSMQQYINLLYQYLISPGLGFLILGGIFLSGARILSARIKPKADKQLHASEPQGTKLGYGELFQFFLRSLVTNRILLLCFVGVSVPTLLFAYYFNFLHPLPPVASVAFTLFFLLAAGFVNFIILTKMSGEAGISSGIHSVALFMVPLFAVGYQGYTGYVISPGHPDPLNGSALVGYAKISNDLDLDLKSIVRAVLINWIPSFIASVFFVLTMWKAVGFRTAAMPSIGLIQTLPIYRMFAERTTTGILDPAAFLAGGALGAVLEAFTPASMMGIALGMLLPPFYGVSFGIGGIIRLYTDRKYGKEFYREKGVLAASGLIAGGIITQVIMSIVLVFSGMSK